MAATNIVALQAEVEAVADTLKDSVEKVTERGEKLGTLDQRADDLQDGALQFRRKTIELERQMWWENRKLKVMIGVGIALLVILIVVLIVYYFAL